jgi:hypothetical protein
MELLRKKSIYWKKQVNMVYCWITVMMSNILIMIKRKVIPVPNYIIKHYAMKAYEGVEIYL